MKIWTFARSLFSLRGKVMLIVAAGMTLVFTILAVLVYETEQRLIEREFIHNYSESAKSLASLISRPILERNLNLLQVMLDLKAKEENIRYILVRDSQGNIVARAGTWRDHDILFRPGRDPAFPRQLEGAAGGPGDHHQAIQPERYFFEVDAVVPDLDIAGVWTVHLGVDTRRTNREVFASTLRIILLAGIVLVVAMTMMFIIDRRLRRIFRELIEVTCRMASGDRSLRVDIRTGDELQVLGESFNAMANALREKEEQVRSYAEDLEGRVRERTQALLAEKLKLTAILGAIRAGLILYAPGPRVVWVNEIAQGWLRGEGALPAVMQRELFKGSEGVEWVARRVLEEKVALETEKQIENPSGELCHFQIFAAPISTESSEGLQVLLLLLDVTENRNLERELQQAGKMAAIGELAGGVAHEVNTPVGVVIAKTEFLLERLQDRLSPKDVEDLRKILKNAQRIASLARDFLSFSRRSGAQRSDIAVNGVVQEALGLHKESLEAAGVKVSTSLAPDVPLIHANAGEIQQVLSNLISNAMDAMSAFNGRRELELATARENRCVVIRVSDTGCGIPANLKERIFEPFFSTKGVGKGTGLGLAISLGIVKAHGGEVLVESIINERTTFTVRLPAGSRGSNRDGESASRPFESQETAPDPLR